MTNKNTTIRNLVVFTMLVNALAWLGLLLGGSPAEPGLGVLVWGAAQTAIQVTRFDIDDGSPIDMLGNSGKVFEALEWYLQSGLHS